MQLTLVHMVLCLLEYSLATSWNTASSGDAEYKPEHGNMYGTVERNAAGDWGLLQLNDPSVKLNNQGEGPY